MSTFFENLLAVSLDAAPWLLFGLIVAGLIKVLIPVAWLNRWLGGPGIMPVINAALLGTPLPLCSCSVVPAALAIRRSGATRGATTSFLIATPENGADSIALSYALLGPVLMIARPVAAIVIAVATGFSVSLFVGESDHTASKSNDTESNTQTPSCCESEKPEPEKKSCCCSGGTGRRRAWRCRERRRRRARRRSLRCSAPYRWFTLEVLANLLYFYFSFTLALCKHLLSCPQKESQ